MKLSELCEMAIRNPAGYDISQEDFDEEVKNFKDSRVIKQINSAKFLKHCINNSNEIYTLWLDDEVISYVVLKSITINSMEMLSLLFAASDPSKNMKGYASELIWELHLAIEDNIFIGGAVSPKGEKLVLGLAKTFKAMKGADLPMINSLTGEKETFDLQRFMSKPKLGVLLEDGCMFESYKDVGGSRVWLNSNVDFTGY